MFCGKANNFSVTLQYHKEVRRLVTGDARSKVAGSLMDFAKQWMRFVCEKCERGRGIRPRYVVQTAVTHRILYQV